LLGRVTAVKIRPGIVKIILVADDKRFHEPGIQQHDLVAQFIEFAQ